MAQTIRTVARSFKRVQNSTNGNPRYAITTDHGTFKTTADAGWVYGLSVARTEGREVVMTIDGRNTIADLRLA